MKKTHFADPYKLFFSLLTAGVCLLFGVFSLSKGDWRGVLPLLLALPFLYIAWLYGALISVTPEGVRCRRPGRPERELPWSGIAEMGVCGTKVFNRSNPNRTGSMYIYFSPSELDEDERFKMVLKWPPQEQIYLLYTKDRMEAFRPLWHGEVRAYNTGKLKKF